MFYRGVTPERRLYMGKEFTVDTEYPGYVFLGSAQGLFDTQDGRRLPCFNMFVFL